MNPLFSTLYFATTQLTTRVRHQFRLFFALGLVCSLLLVPQIGWAYTQSITQRISSSGQTLTFDFLQLKAAGSAIKVTVDLYGDYASSSEYATLTADGTSIGTHRGGARDCNTTVVGTDSRNRQVFTAPATLADDGKLQIRARNTYSVGTCSYPSSSKITVTIEYTIKGPDLELSTFTRFPSNGRPGSNVTFTYRIKNSGGADAGPFSIKFYYSGDATITPRDTILQTIQVSGLKKGLSYPASGNGVVTIKLPSNIAIGARAVGILVDPENKVTESTETNNSASASLIAVGGVTLADLRFTQFALDKLATGPGAVLQLSYRIFNSEPVNATAFKIRIYRSTDATITASDTLLKEIVISAGLKANTYYPSAGPSVLRVTVPSNASGKVYFGAIVDVEQKVSETSEDNNTGLATLQILIRPDFKITVFKPSQSTISPGQYINVSYGMINQGSADSTKTTYLRFYLSTDKTITTSDTYLTQVTVPALKAGAPFPLNGTGSIRIYISTSYRNGNYHLGAIADYSNAEIELDETNNTSATPVVLKTKPDLYAYYLRPTISAIRPGTRLTISYRIRNAGRGASGPFKANFYYSSDSLIDGNDTLLTDVTIANINPSAYYPSSSYATVTVTIPASVVNGTGYIGMVVDPEQKIDETNEANNTSRSTVSVSGGVSLPDLQANYLRLRSTIVRPGLRATISYRVYNGGLASAAPSKLRFYYSKDTTFDNGDVLLQEILIPTLPTRRYSPTSGYGPATPTIPTQLPTGQGYLLMLVDGPNDVRESAENNNFRSLSIDVQPPSDLRFSQFTLNSTNLALRGVVTVKVRAENTGGRMGTSTYLRFYYSTDATITRTDTYLGYVTISALAAKGFYPGASPQVYTRALTIPSTAKTGQGYIGAILDEGNREPESNEANNTTSVAVTLTSKSDLYFSYVRPTTSSVRPSTRLSVSVRLRNQGTNTAGASKLRVYYSHDNTFDSKDLLLATVDIPSMGVNAYDPRSGYRIIPFTMPTGIANGSRYLLLRADATDQVDESNESNNLSSTRISVTGGVNLPDLYVNYLYPRPTSGSPGSSMVVSYRIYNYGPGTAPASTLRFYYSNDPTVTTNDILLKEVTIPTLPSGRYYGYATVSLTLPPNVQNGRRVLGAIIDPMDTITEGNEANNFRVYSITISGAKPFPDLQIASFSLNKSAVTGTGASLDVNYQIKNGGQADSKAYSVGVYYGDNSLSASSLTLLKQVSLGPLNKGATTTKAKLSITLPKQVREGTRGIHLIVDSQKAVIESDESNNQQVLALQVTEKPDFQVPTLILGSTTVQQGGTVNLGYRVSNAGLSQAPGTVIRIYFSTDATITAQDTQIAQVLLPALDAQSTQPGTGNALLKLSLPPTLPVGTGYFGVFVDPSNSVAEKIETNNTKAVAVKVIRPIKADLTVTSLTTSPVKAKAGQSFTLNYQLKNTGTLDSAGFTVHVYFSGNAIINTIDQLLYSFKVAGLKAGASVSGTQVIKLPTSLPGIKAYIGLYVDPDFKISELDEGNNTKSTPFTVLTDRDQDGFFNDIDCDDNDKTINPKAKEICDNKDNNCDGKIDEGVSRACYTGPAGTQGKGLCKEGAQACAAGQWGLCNGQVVPTTESCDNKDNNCDGKVDNAPQCKSEPTPERPNEKRGNDAGTTDAGPPETARDRANCYSTGCPTDQICQKGTCIADPCKSVSCQTDEFCREGQCVKACGCTKCPKGESCQDGKCAADVCAGISCKSGEACDNSNGQCKADPCQKTSCQTGTVCLDGKCIDKPCAYVTCPGGSQCQSDRQGRAQCVQQQCGETNAERPAEATGEALAEKAQEAILDSAQEQTSTDASTEATSPKEANTEAIVPDNGGNDMNASPDTTKSEPGTSPDSGSTEKGTGNKERKSRRDAIAPEGGCGCQQGRTGNTSLFWLLFLGLMLWPLRRKQNHSQASRR